MNELLEHKESAQALSDAFAFLGNSLLAPMTQTEAVGLDPAFWQAFPTFDNDEVAQAVQACEAYAQQTAQRAAEGENVVQNCAVEYTHLFVGPPRPAAAPWETMYRAQAAMQKAAADAQKAAAENSDGAPAVRDVAANPQGADSAASYAAPRQAAAMPASVVGFGQATFEMQDLLRKAGLQVQNENNQYADHMGIELLLLSELCRRAAAGSAAENVAAVEETLPAEFQSGEQLPADLQSPVLSPEPQSPALPAELQPQAFAAKHPASWVGAFRAAVAADRPNGYFDNILGLTQALLSVVCE